ncbi:unnamed protein product [Coregonus sp. 'balchen']|nr:unnamed protein product [Coregonus sp. 'balchen']
MEIKGPTEIEVGQKFTLTCSADSNPPANYTWMLNGTEIPGHSPEFPKEKSEYSDSGDYTCTATNDVTRIKTSEVHKLSVKVEGALSPDGLSSGAIAGIVFGGLLVVGVAVGVSVLHQEKRNEGDRLDVLYGSGSDLTLSCSSESSPPAQFQWALNGTLLSNMGPELRLENIQGNQSGSYSCWAHNTRTLRYQTSEPSDITVLEPISGAIITTSPKSSNHWGGFCTLTCDASGSIISREWMEDGQLLSAGGNMIISEDNRVLSINPVKRTDSGQYLCRVSNPISTADAKHILIVNYGPDGMEIKGPTEIEVGQKFTLTCSADSNPPARYTWMLNGTEIPGHSHEFTKENSEYSDRGNYTCTATNYVTVTKTSVVLKLSVKVEDSLSPGLPAGAIVGIVIGMLLVAGGAVGVAVFFIRKYATNAEPMHRGGSDLTLSCSSESSPPAQFQWALNGTLLSNMGPELRLENIHANQSGSYSCWAHNTRTLRTNIWCYHNNFPKSSNHWGGFCTLTCDASGSIISREWMEDGQLLSAGGNMIISEDNRVLSINPVKRTDSGQYLCRVSNPISTADAKHILIVNLEDSLSPGLPAGAIVGIVIGILLVAGGAVGVAVFFIRKYATNAEPMHRGGSQQPVYENPSALCENPQPNKSLPRPLTEMQDFRSTYDTKIMVNLS